MRASTKWYLSFLLVTMIAGCGDKKDDTTTDSKAPSQVVAKVNDAELTVHQVNYALQRMPNLDKDQSKAASLQVVRNLVDQEVLVQKALADKLDRDPMVVQGLDAARRQILAEAYMSRKLGTTAEPSEAEVLTYYDEHPELFAQRKIYRLQEIWIKATQDKYDAIRAQLAASQSLNEFVEWLKAEKYEIKVTQGVKPAEQLPLLLLPQLAKMPDGQAMAVNSPNGLMVIVLADSQVQPVTLETAKPVIVRKLQTNARQNAAKAELDALKAAAKIEYLGEFTEASKPEEVPAVEPAPAAAVEPAPAAGAKPSAAPASAPDSDADADAISKGISGLK